MDDIGSGMPPEAFGDHIDIDIDLVVAASYELIDPGLIDVLADPATCPGGGFDVSQDQAELDALLAEPLPEEAPAVAGTVGALDDEALMEWLRGELRVELPAESPGAELADQAAAGAGGGAEASDLGDDIWGPDHPVAWGAGSGMEDHDGPADHSSLDI